jgi:hypothetical protein
VDKATVELSTAQIEINEFSESAGGTRVDWIIACDPRDEFTFLAGNRPMEAFLDELHTDCMKALEAYLQKR